MTLIVASYDFEIFQLLTSSICVTMLYYICERLYAAYVVVLLV